MMRLSVMIALAVLESIAARPEITRDVKIELPGSEKINRRSPQERYYSRYSPARDKSSEEYFYVSKRSQPNNDESGLGLNPLLHVKSEPLGAGSTLDEQKEDPMTPEETGIVYVPLFGAKDRDGVKGRVRRSNNDNKKGVIGTPADLETAEDIVFRPLFRHKQRLRQSNSESIFGSRLVFQNQYS
ncbi:hypothetical protein PPYR_00631 [Photinus pyralis]|uniref:Uncharacterized protein n=1 Tax=Photinus pyralis TaxID=7054 RepID=A0A1Y1MWB2_PHOPY|nr:uncharacterized protein LOC116181495 [Photinus pyralis]XP_031357745.1 uncharacterized protein LOC116181495 [Photinus pyralis]KAB0803661.1 hypothetical protein PPYR_00631 [Photinus pyralis]